MRTALLAVALAFAPVAVGATTIIVLRTPTRIVLAGDGFATVADQAGARVRGGDCKVRRGGRWWFVTGGFSESAGVDVRQLVAAAIAPAATMPEALRAIQRLYESRLRAGLQAAKFFYAKRVGAPALAIYVAGMSEGVLTVGSFGVDVQAAEPFTLVTYGATCPGRLCPEDGRLFVGNSVSDRPALALLRTTPRPTWLESADPAAARKLIELQAVATPERVGRPITVLEIAAAGGARWVGPRSTCAAIH